MNGRERLLKTLKQEKVDRVPNEEACGLSFAVAPEHSQGRPVLAGTTRGLFLSGDDGQHWEHPGAGQGHSLFWPLHCRPDMPGTDLRGN